MPPPRPLRVIAWNVRYTQGLWESDQDVVKLPAGSSACRVMAKRDTGHNIMMIFADIAQVLDDLRPACLLTQGWGLHGAHLPLDALATALDEHLGVVVPHHRRTAAWPRRRTRAYQACIDGPYVTFVHLDYEVLEQHTEQVDPAVAPLRTAQVLRIRKGTQAYHRMPTYRLVNVLTGWDGIGDTDPQLDVRARRQMFLAASCLLASRRVLGSANLAPSQVGSEPRPQDTFGVATGHFASTDKELQKWASALELASSSC